MDIQWDRQKAESNLAKHGVMFSEAATIFNDPLAVTFPDPDSEPREYREITFGISGSGSYLVVVHHKRAGTVRIISARKMTRPERQKYEQDEVREMRDEYNVEELGQGVRGKYLDAYRQGARTMQLEPDVAAAFPTQQSVNDALRTLIEVANRCTVQQAGVED